jgi:hypothetical protein
MRSGPLAPGRAPAAATSGLRRAPNAAESTRVYVYGIVPADTDLDGGQPGVGDPPGRVAIVRHDDIGALVSEVSAHWSMGSPRDLTVHKQVLDAIATRVPVLPVRFGSTVADADSVAEQLLATNHDQLAAALSELRDRVQYVIKGRYQEETILREVLAESREAARLRERLRAAGAGAGRMGSAKLRLGEIIGRSIEAKREQDTHLLATRMAGHCEASVFRAPQHERDAVQIAVLVHSRELKALQDVVDDQAARWRNRVDLRLLGPMAAYDFVATNTGRV